jgi:hypothetical protein
MEKDYLVVEESFRGGAAGTHESFLVVQNRLEGVVQWRPGANGLDWLNRYGLR